MQEMDQHQLWLSTKSTKISNEDVIIGDEEESHQEEIQINNLESLPLPAWITHADETCMNQIICKDYSRETCVNHQGKINQLSPEELSLEDVQQLQKLNRELQAENIKKTLSYMMLEQDYNSLQDEIAVVRKDLKHWQECSGIMKLALREICSNRKFVEPDIKLEETIELKFLSETSPPNGSLRYPIEEPADLRKDVKQPHSFSELPSVPVSHEVSPRMEFLPFNNNIVFNGVDEMIPRSPMDFSHCPTGVLVDLSEDANQLQLSNEPVPISDEMSPRIKCPSSPSSVKKKCVFGSEDELTPRPPKDLSHFPTGECFDLPKDVKQQQGSSESVREMSPRPKISSAYYKKTNVFNPTNAKKYIKGPPKYLVKKEELKCHVCDIYLNSEDQLFGHYQGKRHNLNYDEWLLKDNN